MSAGVTVRPAGDAVDPAVWDLLGSWLPDRRWYPGGSGEVRQDPWLAVTFDGTPEVVDVLLRLEGRDLPGGAVVLQVPLVLTPPDAAGPGLVDLVTTRSGKVAVHDGGQHPRCWLALLSAMGVEGEPDTLLARGRAISGEQSNTSVVLPGVPSEAGTGGMLKVLRTVAQGPHPDVLIPQALTDAGWDGVPRFLGAVEIATPASESASGEGSGAGEATAHLAVLAELVPDAQDGFELACELAGRGESFAPLAADLGRVLAELHTVLRRALPEGPGLDASAFVAVLRRRAGEAVDAAPELADRADEVRAVLDDLESRLSAEADAAPLQTIHGDLHLGQVLHGDAGWKVLDFEGEPQRPVEERTAPDLPLRDVAGILRSLGYAAAVGEAQDPAWETEAADAFLDAYRVAAGPPAGTRAETADAVLRALVLDKALYEVVYEVRNRPHWVGIPMAAVDRALTA